MNVSKKYGQFLAAQNEPHVSLPLVLQRFNIHAIH